MLGDVTLQIVRDWVVKFNAHGPDGHLIARPRANRQNSMTRTARR